MNPIKMKEALYSWFASFYLNAPTAKLLRPLANIKLLSILNSVSQDDHYRKALKELTAYVKRTRLEDLRDEFYDLFVVPNKRNYVPPYESCFRERRGNELGNLWGETTADVAAFYRKAGYEAQNLQNVFAPDHIGIELAFVAKLCADELKLTESGDSMQAKKAEELRVLFLRGHISKWIEDFSNAIDSSPSAIFYEKLSKLTVHLVYSDLKSSK